MNIITKRKGVPMCTTVKEYTIWFTEFAVRNLHSGYEKSINLRFTTTMALVAFVLFTTNLTGSAQSVLSQSSGTESPTKISVEFKVPKNFRLERSTNSEIAFMRHEKEELALFVVVPKTNQPVDDLFISELSNVIVTQLLPRQEGFVWKNFRQTERRMSPSQIDRGTVKGLNNRVYVQADYVVLKAQQQEIVVGSVAVFGNEREAKYLFDKETFQYSFSGWDGLFQLIASVTGEKHE